MYTYAKISQPVRLTIYFIVIITIIIIHVSRPDPNMYSVRHIKEHPCTLVTSETLILVFFHRHSPQLSRAGFRPFFTHFIFKYYLEPLHHKPNLFKLISSIGSVVQN